MKPTLTKRMFQAVEDARKIYDERIEALHIAIKEEFYPFDGKMVRVRYTLLGKECETLGTYWDFNPCDTFIRIEIPDGYIKTIYIDDIIDIVEVEV